MKVEVVMQRKTGSRGLLSNGSVIPAQAQCVVMDNEGTVVIFSLGYKIKSMINFTLGRGVMVCKTGQCSGALV